MTHFYLLNYDTLITSNSNINIVRRDLKNSNVKILDLIELSMEQYYRLIEYFAKTNSKCTISSIKSY